MELHRCLDAPREGPRITPWEPQKAAVLDPRETAKPWGLEIQPFWTSPFSPWAHPCCTGWNQARLLDAPMASPWAPMELHRCLDAPRGGPHINPMGAPKGCTSRPQGNSKTLGSRNAAFLDFPFQPLGASLLHRREPS